MSIRRKVSMKHAILQVVEETDDMYLRYLPMLLKWGKQSYLRIMGSDSIIEDVAHLTVDENKAELPLSAVYVVISFLGNITISPGEWGTEIIAQIGELNINGEQQLFLYSGSTIFELSGIPWRIQDNNIVFDRNLDDQEITVIFNKIISDPEGIPLIEEELAEPIAKFIEFKLAEKENSMKFRRANLKPADIAYVRGLKRDYHNLVTKSRATTTPAEHNQIALMFNYGWTGSSVI